MTKSADGKTIYDNQANYSNHWYQTLPLYMKGQLCQTKNNIQLTGHIIKVFIKTTSIVCVNVKESTVVWMHHVCLELYTCISNSKSSYYELMIIVPLV